MEMQVEIITPDTKLYEGLATSVVLPGADGLFEILEHHAPLISALGEGQLTYHTGEATQSYGIDGGVVEVHNDKVSVLIEGVKQEA